MRPNNNIHFGFYRGSQLTDTDKVVLGAGNQYRYVLVADKKKFPKAYIKKLVQEAYVNSLSMVKDPKQLMHGYTIVKSIAAKKRPDKAKKQISLKRNRVNIRSCLKTSLEILYPGVFNFSKAEAY